MPPQGHIPHSERIKVRVRSQRACGPCRRRKIKCDGNHPCAACVGYGYDCVFIQHSEARPSRLSSTATAEAASSPVRPNGRSNVDIPSEPAAPIIRRPSTSAPAKVTQPFMGQESIVPDSNGKTHLLQHIKTRFTNAYSAVAWPKRLGLSLGLANPPRLQAFGWNAGTRPEQNYVPSTTIRDIVSLADMNYYAKLYFEVVHPFFGFLHPDWFASRTTDFWVVQQDGTDFEACLCGVYALGSYFSSDKQVSPLEAQVVEHGRLLLDMSTAFPPAMISVKHVAAWILRTIYLRLTTRSHISWMASCTAVHLAESVGLHREINEIQRPRDIPQLEIELRRRTFWVALRPHEYISTEYGRSSVVLHSIACLPIASDSGNITLETLAILHSVPDHSYIGKSTELLEAFQIALELPAPSPFLVLL